MFSKSEYIKASLLLVTILVLPFSAEWWAGLILAAM